MKYVNRIIEIAHHRNGISGAPFHAVVFDGCDGTSRPARFLAIVHEQPGYCSVIQMDKLPTVTFGANSWRGDHYETELRAAIDQWESDRDAAFMARYATNRKDGNTP